MNINETFDYEKIINGLPLSGTHTTIPIIGILYLFSIHFGKKIMENKEPFNNIKNNIIPLFNFFQVFANGFLIIKVFYDITFVKKSINNLCGNETMDVDYNVKYIYLGYYWCLLKISDFLDTIFFVLLKKNSHISFLHVYHHFTTMLVAFYVFKYNPLEQAIIYAGVNCLVHVVMYFYYMLTSLGFKPKWKKLVTLLQLLQFFGLMFLSLRLFFCQTNIRYFSFTIYAILQCLMYIYLFGNFYKKTYKVKEN